MQTASLPRGVQPFSAPRNHLAYRIARSTDPTNVSDYAVGPGPGSMRQQAATFAAQGKLATRQRRSWQRTCAAAPPHSQASVAAKRPHSSSVGTFSNPATTTPESAGTTTTTLSRSTGLNGSSSSNGFLPDAAASSRDLRLDLWASLLQASAEQLLSATASAAAAANGVATRLQRMSQPPPPSFPAGPPGDQTLSLLSDPLNFLTGATSRFGPLVGLLLGGERVVLVTGRDEAHTVLVEEAGSVYVKEGTAFFPGSSLAGNGLLVSDGATWQRQRRLSNPAFRRAAVEAYASAIVAATTDMMDSQWAAGATRDVYADFNELTLRVTLEALFGFGGSMERPQAATGMATAWMSSSTSSGSSTSSDEDAQQIVAAVEKAFTFFTQRAATGFVIPEWLPTWDNLEFAAAVQQLDRVVYGMINRRREELVSGFGSLDAAAAAAAAQAAGVDAGSTGAAVPTDLLTRLLLSRDEDGSGMTDQALRDELMTLLVAGQETSAILLGWASALLAAHPEVQDWAAAEVAAVCGQTQPPTPASVRHMPYLEAVVLETLRLYSPAYMVGRCARADAALGPYILPAGTTVLVSPYVMHRDPDVWEEPNTFRPERWREIQSREGYTGYMGLMSNLGPNGAYLPFGGGPRNCVGTGFAMMEALLVLAGVLQRYRLELLPLSPATPPRPSGHATAAGSALPASFPKPKPLLTLRPESVMLRITPRSGGP